MKKTPFLLVTTAIMVSSLAFAQTTAQNTIQQDRQQISQDQQQIQQDQQQIQQDIQIEQQDLKSGNTAGAAAEQQQINQLTIQINQDRLQNQQDWQQIGYVESPASKNASIWFAPKSPPLTSHYYDFLALFQTNPPPNASWQQAASHVSVVEVYEQYVLAASSTQLHDLQTIFAWLKQRHISLALGVGMVNPTNKNPGTDICPTGSAANCGHNNGGGGQYLAQALQSIQGLGGTVDYLEMDEPLWYDHIGRNGEGTAFPNASIAVLAANVAVQVATARKYFPNIQIGDVEPVMPDAAPADYLTEVQQWMNAYKADTGTPLAFFHCDVSWPSSAVGSPGLQTQLQQLSQQTRANGIKFGIIYDGTNPDDFTGTQWTADAENNFVGLESNPQMVPDQAMIQSWVAQPEYNLPETTPGTMTYLVDRYAAAETILAVSKSGTVLPGRSTGINAPQYDFAGRLTTYTKPVPDAQISAYAVNNAVPYQMATVSLQNVVPANAVKAVIGLRANVDCFCDGPINIGLGSAQYTDNTTHQSVARTLMPANTRLVLTAQQNSAVNSAAFPVTAGDNFTLSIPMDVPYSSSHSGYVAIMFLDSAGNGIAPRLELPFTPAQSLIWSGSTGPDGYFNVRLPSSIVKFNFADTATLRSSSALVQ